MEDFMILKMMHTNNGNVLIDNIEQATRVGISYDCGDTVKVIRPDGETVLKTKEDVLYDILSLYNLSEDIGCMHVFNLVLRSNVDNRKEYRTILFRGPGFLMNNTGHTMETYEIPE